MSAQVACQVSDLAPGEAREVQLQNAAGQPVKIAIVRDHDGSWHAIDAMCTHGEVSLAEGDVEDGCIECWGHGAQFNLVTGEPTLPATSGVKVYPLNLAGPDVLVEIAD